MKCGATFVRRDPNIEAQQAILSIFAARWRDIESKSIDRRKNLFTVRIESEFQALLALEPAHDPD
jgi:hypothetical protein